jgi:hypothetical protein
LREPLIKWEGQSQNRIDTIFQLSPVIGTGLYHSGASERLRTHCILQGEKSGNVHNAFRIENGAGWLINPSFTYGGTYNLLVACGTAEANRILAYRIPSVGGRPHQAPQTIHRNPAVMAGQQKAIKENKR